MSEPNRADYPPDQLESELTLPPQTSDRDYDRPKQSLADLLPGSPRERGIVEAFKKTIAQHLNDVDVKTKTTKEFMDDLALDLWRITRVPYK